MFNYKNYQKKDVVKFSEISLNGSYGYEIIFEKHLEKHSQN